MDYSFQINQSTEGQSSIRKGPPPRVILAIDTPGWAFHHISTQLKKYLSDEFTFIIRPYKELRNETADICVFFWWRSIELALRDNMIKKSILCLYDHFSFCKEQWRQFEFECAMKNANILVVSNERIGEMVRARKLDTKPIYLVEDGVDCEQFFPAQFPTLPTFGWCGNARAGHGTIKGLNLIREACGKTNSRLKILDVSNSDRVMAHDDMASWYNDISCYICASSEEGTPNPPLEAMACGRPVISTRCGILNRVISHGSNGLFVDRNVESIADAIVKMKTSNHLEMGLKARASVLAHDWKYKIQFWRAALWAAIEG